MNLAWDMVMGATFGVMPTMGCFWARLRTNREENYTSGVKPQSRKTQDFLARL